MSLLFYTAANKEYEAFAPIYIYFALNNNPNSYIEIGVEDANSYRSNNKEQIDILRRLFGDRFKFTSVNFNGILPGAVRFITKPTLARNCDYVYIGDIDILLFDDDIKEQHLKNMRRHNVSYSNIIRGPAHTEGDNYRLSGLHFAPTDVQYPLPDLSNINYSIHNTIRGADEHVLYQIMKEKDELVPENMKFRPEHGIHIRTNNYPFGERGKYRPKSSFDEIANGNQNTAWSGLEVSHYREAFLQSLMSKEFQELYFTLDMNVKNMLIVLENACRGRFDQFEKEAFTYMIAESHYESLLRQGLRSLYDDGLSTTLYKIMKYLY
ncbi:hypothetical protein [Natronosalvus amylolyticus]|uniref:hypothetical protein n=1 Tax=Natronosalvus amylolyticus TaxID=2961994 RepID=UPI0020C9E66A|nr:hypothetical protein [Natronosalvus amylolyticus]